jgi:uncharacterized protein
MLSSTERNWAMACHLSALCGYVIPLGWILGPLVVWLIKREEFEFVDDQGKEALNFQISVLIYGIVSAILCLLLIGFLLLFALAIFHLVMVIVASVKASSGIRYRYPLTIRFLK